MLTNSTWFRLPNCRNAAINNRHLDEPRAHFNNSNNA